MKVAVLVTASACVELFAGAENESAADAFEHRARDAKSAARLAISSRKDGVNGMGREAATVWAMRSLSGIRPKT